MLVNSDSESSGVDVVNSGLGGSSSGYGEHEVDNDWDMVSLNEAIEEAQQQQLRSTISQRKSIPMSLRSSRKSSETKDITKPRLSQLEKLQREMMGIKL